MLDPTSVPPEDPPCPICKHELSHHEDYTCDECVAWGGPCE
jgi:hypothetical protein